MVTLRMMIKKMAAVASSSSDAMIHKSSPWLMLKEQAPLNRNNKKQTKNNKKQQTNNQKPHQTNPNPAHYETASTNVTPMNRDQTWPPSGRRVTWLGLPPWATGRWCRFLTDLRFSKKQHWEMSQKVRSSSCCFSVFGIVADLSGYCHLIVIWWLWLEISYIVHIYSMIAALWVSEVVPVWMGKNILLVIVNMA